MDMQYDVAVRIKPAGKTTCISVQGRHVTVEKGAFSHTFSNCGSVFQSTPDLDASQEEIFAEFRKKALDVVDLGGTVSVVGFGAGQTGKAHTLFGSLVRKPAVKPSAGARGDRGAARGRGPTEPPQESLQHDGLLPRFASQMLPCTLAFEEVGVESSRCLLTGGAKAVPFKIPNQGTLARLLIRALSASKASTTLHATLHQTGTGGTIHFAELGQNAVPMRTMVQALSDAPHLPEHAIGEAAAEHHLTHALNPLVLGCHYGVALACVSPQGYSESSASLRFLDKWARVRLWPIPATQEQDPYYPLTCLSLSPEHPRRSHTPEVPHGSPGAHPQPSPPKHTSPPRHRVGSPDANFDPRVAEPWGVRRAGGPGGGPVPVGELPHHAPTALSPPPPPPAGAGGKKAEPPLGVPPPLLTHAEAAAGDGEEVAKPLNHRDFSPPPPRSPSPLREPRAPAPQRVPHAMQTQTTPSLLHSPLGVGEYEPPPPLQPLPAFEPPALEAAHTSPTRHRSPSPPPLPGRGITHSPPQLLPSIAVQCPPPPQPRDVSPTRQRKPRATSSGVPVPPRTTSPGASRKPPPPVASPRRGVATRRVGGGGVRSLSQGARPRRPPQTPEGRELREAIAALASPPKQRRGMSPARAAHQAPPPEPRHISPPRARPDGGDASHLAAAEARLEEERGLRRKAETAVSEIRAALARTENDLLALRTDYDGVVAEAKVAQALEQRVAAQEKMIARLQQKVDMVEAEKAVLQKSNDVVESENQQLTQRAHKGSEMRRCYTEENQRLSALYQQSQRELAQAQEDVRELHVESATLRQRNNDQEERLLGASAEGAQKELQITQLVAELQATKADNARLQEAPALYEREVQRLGEEVKRLAQLERSARIQTTKAHSDRRTLQHSIAVLKADYDRQGKEALETKHALESQLAQKIDEQDREVALSEQLRTQLDQQEAGFAARDGAYGQLAAENDKLKAQMADLKQHVKEVKSTADETIEALSESLNKNVLQVKAEAGEVKRLRRLLSQTTVPPRDTPADTPPRESSRSSQQNFADKSYASAPTPHSTHSKAESPPRTQRSLLEQLANEPTSVLYGAE